MSERAEPRISLNQLTEYLVANSTGRKSIIRQQKYPKSFQVIYYQDAQDAIQQFIAGGMSKEEILASRIDDIYSRSTASKYEHTRSISNAEAIDSFLQFYENIDLADLAPSIAPDDQPKLRIGEINISVRPEIILNGDHKRYGQVVGGIKLYLVKRDTARLDNELGKYPSSILYNYLGQQNPNRRPLHQSCIIVDVFGKKQFSAPRTHKKILAHVRVACEEIADRWKHI